MKNLLGGLDVSKMLAEFRSVLVEIRDLLVEIRDYQRGLAEAESER
jgi:hypothetical protein